MLTGRFKYVRWSKVEDHLKAGWMIVSDMAGTHHGYWSALMWRCDCRETP